uniref:Uncharacterized protein n=1 Tax=Lygus hesperus TaxID=30085 RepID=A0A146M5J5_LYGHE
MCAARFSNPYHSFATLLAYYLYKHLNLSENNRNTDKPAAGALTAATATGVGRDKVITFAKLIRQECDKLQLPLDANAIQQRHASDGLASQNQLAAMVLTMEIQTSLDVSKQPILTSLPLLQSVSGFM